MPVAVVGMILAIAALNILGLVMANDPKVAIRSIVGLCGNGLMLMLVLIPTRPTWYIARALSLLGLIGCLIGGAALLMILSRLPAGLAVLAIGELGIGAGLILGIFLSLGSDDSRNYYGFD